MRRKEAACDRSRFEQLLGQSLLLTERLAVRVDIYARTETDRASRSDLHGSAGARITPYACGRQCHREDTESRYYNLLAAAQLIYRYFEQRLHDSLDFVLWQSQIFRDGFDQLRFVHTIEVLRVITFVGKVKLIFFFETANIWDTFYDLRAAKAYTQKSRQNIWWNRKSVILLHSERWQSGRSRRS